MSRWALRSYVFTLIALALAMIVVVVIGLVSGRLANGAENDFREICDATNSEFTKAGGQWLCVRDGEVVYPR